MNIQFRSGEIIEGRGSRMPLDTQSHWRWDNPLNLIIAVLVFFCVVAMIGAIL